MGVFDEISAALGGGKAGARSSAPLNKVGYGRDYDTTARDEIRAKMKTLGLETMPEGGQEQLDAMYSQYLQRQQGRSGSMLKSARGK